MHKHLPSCASALAYGTDERAPPCTCAGATDILSITPLRWPPKTRNAGTPSHQTFRSATDGQRQ